MNFFAATNIILFALEITNGTDPSVILTPNDTNQSSMENGVLKNPDITYIYANKIKFFYWTLTVSETKESNYQSVEVKLNEESNLENIWKEKKPLKVVIHGWNSSDESEANIRNAYLERLIEYHVISTDWSHVERLNYFKVARKSLDVGIVLGHFITNLVQHGFVTAEQIHVIGISLGAHVAGSCGRTFFALNETKIARITGLDPAGPGFKGHFLSWNKEDRLDKTDATFVDVIHTSRGKFGITIKIGHADFYPNNGSPSQPPCKRYILWERWFCSHVTAIIYYTESIQNKKSFQSVKCLSNSDYKKGKCIHNPRTYMGNDADPNLHGKFYLKTNKKSPFSQTLRWLP